MKEIYNKLVRDNIPEIIKKDTGIPKFRILDENEYLKELLKKLIEEAEELNQAVRDKEGIEKEIADIYEVLDALMLNLGLLKEKIMKIKEQREKERGGFEKKILESVE